MRCTVEQAGAEVPVAHTDRWGGSALPTRCVDVFDIARDVERFSSTEVTVAPTLDAHDEYAAVKPPPIAHVNQHRPRGHGCGVGGIRFSG